MLEIKSVYKTFNAGTVNEKRAINGIDLKLEDGDFDAKFRWFRRRVICNSWNASRFIEAAKGRCFCTT